MAVRTLTGICGSKAAPAAARVSAASALLDRGWGRAPQAPAAEDDKHIRITIRDLVRERSDQVLDLPAQPVRVIGNGGGDEP